MRQQGVTRSADKAFDFEQLLDSLEKQLNLPAIFVNESNGFGGPVKMIGQDDNDFDWFWGLWNEYVLIGKGIFCGYKSR